MNSKKIFIAIALVLLTGLLVVGATFAWLTWRSSDAEKTTITFTVPNGENQLSATLDMSYFDLSGLAPTSSCAGMYSKYIPVTLEYSNQTLTSAGISATLSLVSITSPHAGSIDRSQIHWALSENPKETCASAIIKNGTGTLSGVTDGGTIYTGDLGVGTITTNTTSSKTLYLYFWIDLDYTFLNVGNSVVTDPMQDMKITVTWTGSIANEPSLYYTITNSQIKSTTPTWSTVPSTAESGLYKITQDGVDIYYYRGNVNNNNVLYDNMCWKIIRTTKTGGIKMIYNGLPDTNNYCGSATTTSQLNEASLALLDGTNTTYKMTDSGASNPDYRQTSLRTKVDSWFANVDDTLLETTDFCIDTQLDSTVASPPYQYMPWTRYTNLTEAPVLECTGTDREVFNSKVGLISVDELVLAGVPKDNDGSKNNKTYYLYNNQNCWTISVQRYDSDMWNINYITADKWGKASNSWYSNALGVRPVISLKSGLRYDGSGTYDDPYVPM